MEIHTEPSSSDSTSEAVNQPLSQPSSPKQADSQDPSALVAVEDPLLLPVSVPILVSESDKETNTSTAIQPEDSMTSTAKSDLDVSARANLDIQTDAVEPIATSVPPIETSPTKPTEHIELVAQSSSDQNREIDDLVSAPTELSKTETETTLPEIDKQVVSQPAEASLAAAPPAAVSSSVSTPSDTATLEVSTPVPESVIPTPSVATPTALASTGTGQASTPAPTTPKADQIPEETEESNPDALLALIARSTAENDLENARKWYEIFLKLYPTAAPQYLTYIELELSHDHTPEVEALFSRAFAKSSSSGPVFPLAYPPLWTSYLHYIRRRNPLPPVPSNVSTLPSDYLNARIIISKAYEYALSHIGTDPLSTPIWKEFIQFIREGETRSTWEEQAKVVELRRVFSKVIKIPVEDVEGIWREYDLFEGMVNKVTAKKFLAERSPAYMTARSTLKELRTKLPHSAFLFPAPLPQRPKWTEQDRVLIQSWKTYVEWEIGNPLELEAVDEVQARVGYAFRKAVGGEGRFYPELWYAASKYHQSVGRLEEGAGYLKLGIQANPTSCLLSFSYAELEESRKNMILVHSTFDSLITNLQTEIDKLHQSIADEVAFVLAAPDKPSASSTAGGGAGGGNDENKDLDQADIMRKKEEDRKAKEASVRMRRAKEVEDAEKGLGLVWIMYMRTVRRSEGIKYCRTVFAKARKSNSITWQVYEASALMEYHCSKDPSVATRIFELGLKVFGGKIEFVDRYLSFLITINDDQNARVLFEKSATKFTAEIVRPLWERWAKYEYLFGDLASAQRLDARFLEMFPKDSVTKHFARRHIYNDIDEIARVDLGFGIFPPVPPALTVQQPMQSASALGPSNSLSHPSLPIANQLGPHPPPVTTLGQGSVIPPRPLGPPGNLGGVLLPQGGQQRVLPSNVNGPMMAGQPPPQALSSLPLNAVPGVTGSISLPLPSSVGGRPRPTDESERMSMRNEPLSKRPRGDSPMNVPSPVHPSLTTSSPAVGPAVVQPIHVQPVQQGVPSVGRHVPPPQQQGGDNGWGRKPIGPQGGQTVPVKRGRSPEPAAPTGARAPVHHKEVSLHWFLGVLPPPTSFAGPQFRTDDLMGLLASDAITAIMPSGPPGNGPPHQRNMPPTEQGYRGRQRGW
ncbi:mRNA cleavage and polyadenylation factor I complex, subunit RNA14 [Phaffia rhodozyma]|uniref:mRNA 3'-end-processing protein RNA14 n=1 Tax=Phaffia rhodozyma TaxID=264483 RepID=A0A0F7SWP6_PHARH|nr:mRNA cleavage and polyadenylation factor I complex, subunit RNA14 [Phaffia rhodozyma]